MIFIWKGAGPIVLAIPPLVLIVVFAIFLPIFGKDWVKANGEVIPIVAGTLSAAIAWKVGRRINREEVRATNQQGETRNYFVREPHHTLFFVPFEYWGAIYIVLTALYTFNALPRV